MQDGVISMRRPAVLRILFALFSLLLLSGGGAALLAQDSTYTVEYGDVLDLIAAGFNVSVDCIAEASGIEDIHRIRPGDTIVIPADCPPYDGQAFVVDTDEFGDQGGGAPLVNVEDGEYVVKSGDLLDTIAASIDVSVTCLAEVSELPDPNRIFKGDVVNLAAAVEQCPPYDGENFVANPREEARAAAEPGGEQGGGGGSGYTVRSGDVLDLIAAAYNLSVSCLAEASGLEDPNRIDPGDLITIDLTCPPYDGLALGAG